DFRTQVLIRNAFGSGAANNNVVEGNYIGTDKTGTVSLSTSFQPAGINDQTSAGGNTIGGTVSGAGNLISGNGGNGVTSNSTITIQGNLIGTTADGNSALGNNDNGIRIDNGPNNFIGGVN